MVRVIHYLLSTGRIIGSLTDYEDLAAAAANAPAGWGVMEAPDQSAQYHPADWYVTGSALAQRVALAVSLDKATIVANSTDRAVITGIPSGADVLIVDGNGATTLSGDGSSLEITAAEAGVIAVSVSHWPYRRTDMTVTAR